MLNDQDHCRDIERVYWVGSLSSTLTHKISGIVDAQWLLLILLTTPLSLTTFPLQMQVGPGLYLLQVGRGTSAVVKSLVYCWKWCTDTPGVTTSSPGRHHMGIWHHIDLARRESSKFPLIISWAVPLLTREEHQVENLSGKTEAYSWPRINLCAGSRSTVLDQKPTFMYFRWGLFSASQGCKDLGTVRTSHVLERTKAV